MSSFVRWVAAAILVLTLMPLAQAQDITVDAGRGPVPVHVPEGYDPAVPTPLVMMLHGYRSSGAGHESYFKLAPLAEARGFIYVAPDGRVDELGNHFWNATDACCDVFHVGGDDSAYLRGLLEAIQDRLSVDARRIFVMGHSNGGFMSYRMACDHADLIAAIAPMSGATFLDPSLCAPSEAVSVLHIHGTRDPIIRYRGGHTQGEYPSAEASLEMWSGYNGCEGRASWVGRADYDGNVEGSETFILRHEAGCPGGGALAHWRMEGSYHMPALTQPFSEAVIDWLLAHPRP